MQMCGATHLVRAQLQHYENKRARFEARKEAYNVAVLQSTMNADLSVQLKR
jgi:hypothetical protein